MSTSAAPPQGTNPLPFLAGLGLAVAGFFVAVSATNTLGCGKDIHALRVVALAFPLFAGGVIAFWPGLSAVPRIAALVIAAAGAFAGWVYTPSSFGGLSLAQAAAKRTAVKATLATETSYNDVAKSPEMAAAVATLAAFPTLTETLQPAVNEWTTAAAERLAERFNTVKPDDIASVDDVTTKANLLTKHFPQAREAVANAERAFSNRSADFWVNELKSVPPGNFLAFRTWGGKRDAVKSILPNPTPIVEAESAWVTSSVEATITRAELIQLFMPQRARDALLTASLEIRTLAGAGAETTPFRAARLRLFMAALARAQEETRLHLEQGAYDQAAERAQAHATGWATEARVLGPETIETLSSFRDGYRYLATLAEKAGVGTDFVPPPRSKP